MDSHDYGQGSWFGNRWLLPLAIGLGIGTLLFTLLPAIGRVIDHPPRLAYPAGTYAPGDRQLALPRADGEASVPRTYSQLGRTWERHHHPFDLAWLSSLFFPFAGFRLAAAALLIGTGVWLLTSQRHGPGSSNRPSAPPSGQPTNASSPTERLEPQSPDDWDPPSTGPTRYL